MIFILLFDDFINAQKFMKSSKSVNLYTEYMILRGLEISFGLTFTFAFSFNSTFALFALFGFIFLFAFVFVFVFAFAFTFAFVLFAFAFAFVFDFKFAFVFALVFNFSNSFKLLFSSNLFLDLKILWFLVFTSFVTSIIISLFKVTFVSTLIV